MAKRLLKCKYCNMQFDANVEPFVEVSSRRYAHKACAEKFNESIPQEEKDYKILEDYIKKKFNIDNVGIRIKKQIKDFREEYKYTYSGMFKTLYWWYEIKDHDIESAQNGIGIIPYIYKDAEEYYYTLYLAKMVNENIIYEPKIEEIEIAPPQASVSIKKLFKFDDDD